MDYTFSIGRNSTRQQQDAKIRKSICETMTQIDLLFAVQLIQRGNETRIHADEDKKGERNIRLCVYKPISKSTQNQSLR